VAVRGNRYSRDKLSTQPVGSPTPVQPGQINPVKPSQQAMPRPMTAQERYYQQLSGYGDDYGAALDKYDELVAAGGGSGRRGGGTSYSQNLNLRRAAQQNFKDFELDPRKMDYDTYERIMRAQYYNPVQKRWEGPGQYRGDEKAIRQRVLDDYNRSAAGARATDFAENLPNYIRGESSSLQQALMDRMNQQRKGLLAEMNRRGLLRSGQKELGEVNLASDTAAQFEQGRADIYKRANEEAQRLFTDPLLKQMGYDARLMDLQRQMEQMRQNEKAARAQLFGNAAGLIGYGGGLLYGGRGGGSMGGGTGGASGGGLYSEMSPF